MYCGNFLNRFKSGERIDAENESRFTINYSTDDGGFFVSTLNIDPVEESDVGEYTCRGGGIESSSGQLVLTEMLYPEDD